MSPSPGVQGAAKYSFTSSSQQRFPACPSHPLPQGLALSLLPSLRVSGGSPGAAVGLPEGRELLPAHRSGLGLLQVDRCRWVTGSPAGAGPAEPGAQMAEWAHPAWRLGHKLMVWSGGPSWAALGQDKVTLACHPALTQEP